MGRKLNKLVIIVVEKLEELEQTIRTSKEVGVEPMIGIRVRLNSKGAGKWTTSGGENAKFGLDTVNLITASEMLKSEGLSHCLKLIHFHDWFNPSASEQINRNEGEQEIWNQDCCAGVIFGHSLTEKQRSD